MVLCFVFARNTTCRYHGLNGGSSMYCVQSYRLRASTAFVELADATSVSIIMHSQRQRASMQPLGVDGVKSHFGKPGASYLPFPPLDHDVPLARLAFPTGRNQVRGAYAAPDQRQRRDTQAARQMRNTPLLHSSAPSSSETISATNFVSPNICFRWAYSEGVCVPFKSAERIRSAPCTVVLGAYPQH